MAYYVELSGGKIAPAVKLSGGGLVPGARLSGGSIYATGSGGGGPVNLQSKSVSYTPTESAQTDQVTADQGYDGLSEVDVSVGAISSTYVGSGITRRSSSNLYRSGSTITAPAGYYENSASKSVITGPNPYLSYAEIDNNGDLYVDIEEGDGWRQEGTTGASLTGAFSVQAAQMIYPSSSDQTIASGKYLTGAQTIKGVTTTNLSAGNIKKDVVVEVGDSADPDRILSITGTYEGGGGGATFNFTGATDKLWGGMAKALVDGTYKSGSVTFTTAFTNSWQTLIDTGLTTLEGFCAWMRDATSTASNQQDNDYLIFNVLSSGNLDYVGLQRPTGGINTTPPGKRHTNMVQGTNFESAGIQGAIRINGGIIEYKGRYNKNASYQIFPTNTPIEWIAW